MRNLLLVLGVALAAGAVAWLTRDVGVGAAAVDPAPGVPDASGETRPPLPGPTLHGSKDPERASATLPDPARLKVTVCDREGGPLLDARITLRVDDQVREHVGRTATFDDLRVDAGVLRVEHEGLPTWERRLTLRAGKLTSLVVKLQQELLLRGHVVDRFGDGLPGKQVWFLRAGERHPVDASAAQRLLSAVSDRDGELAVALPEEGSWRLSVGRVNDIELTDSTRALSHGGPDRFEAVLGGHTRLEVRVDYPGDPEPVTAAVLARTEDLMAEREDPYEGEYDDRDDDPVRRKRMEAALARGAYEPKTPEQIAQERPLWANRQSRRVANDGHVVFKSLPAGQELRMALIRPGERFESDVSFSLTPDRRAVVELDLPASTGSAELALPLALRWRSEPLDEGERPVGVHWRN